MTVERILRVCEVVVIFVLIVAGFMLLGIDDVHFLGN